MIHMRKIVSVFELYDSRLALRNELNSKTEMTLYNFKIILLQFEAAFKIIIENVILSYYYKFFFLL